MVRLKYGEWLADRGTVEQSAPWWNSRYHGGMALNLKNKEAERLAAQVAQLTGESKTEAVRRSLEERLQRIETATAEGDRERRMREFLAREVWAKLPPDQRGRRLTEAEEDDILGYEGSGV